MRRFLFPLRPALFVGTVLFFGMGMPGLQIAVAQQTNPIVQQMRTQTGARAPRQNEGYEFSSRRPVVGVGEYEIVEYKDVQAIGVGRDLILGLTDSESGLAVLARFDRDTQVESSFDRLFGTLLEMGLAPTNLTAVIAGGHAGESEALLQRIISKLQSAGIPITEIADFVSPGQQRNYIYFASSFYHGAQVMQGSGSAWPGPAQQSLLVPTASSLDVVGRTVYSRDNDYYRVKVTQYRDRQVLSFEGTFSYRGGMYDYTKSLKSLKPGKTVIVSLNSGGGTLGLFGIAFENLRKAVGDAKIVTFIGDQKKCLSACFDFFGQGDFRIAHPGAKFGFHLAVDQFSGKQNTESRTAELLFDKIPRQRGLKEKLLALGVFKSVQMTYWNGTQLGETGFLELLTEEKVETLPLSLFSVEGPSGAAVEVATGFWSFCRKAFSGLFR